MMDPDIIARSSTNHFMCKIKAVPVELSAVLVEKKEILYRIIKTGVSHAPPEKVMGRITHSVSTQRLS
jgi:hypothetical protein